MGKAFEIVRKRKAKFPVLKPPEAVLEKIGKVVEASIIDNILKQQQADGSSLQANSPQVRELKRKLGLPTLSLVFKGHRFVKGQGGSWEVTVNVDRGSITIRPATDHLKTVSKALQERGYVGWFAINESGAAAIHEIIRQWIMESFNGAV